MKTRSSSGVGQKIDLGFDVDTLRIFDIGEEDDQATATSTGSSAIANALKRTNGAPTAPDEVREDPNEGSSIGKVRAKTDSTKLRDFLNNLGE
jgi:hypothetical protein